MKIDDLPLKNKNDLVTIRADETALNAAVVLSGHNIGALPVCDTSGALIGIISERDIVRGVSENARGLTNISVAELMTCDVITCHPDDDVNDIMSVMDERRIRHIPVMRDNRLSAIISSRDVLTAVLEETRNHCKTLGLAYEMVR